MVRKLHNRLGIPLKSLVNDPAFELPEQIDTGQFPVKEMHEKGYFPTSIDKKWMEVRAHAEELLQQFFQGRQEHAFPALNRQTTRTKSRVNRQALRAWRCRVLDRAKDAQRAKFTRANFNPTVIEQLKALDTFIPENEWSRLRQLQYAKDIRSEASRLGIPAPVIAGRLRREASDYRKHRTLIGQGKVEPFFPREDPVG
jgi:hypothetical protein